MAKVTEICNLGSYSTGNGVQSALKSKSMHASTSAYTGSVDSTAFTGVPAKLSLLQQLKKMFFTKGTKLTTMQEKILDLMPGKERKAFKTIDSVSDFIEGEMGGIVVTAVGTGLVAPFPIAFNPFTKAAPNATKEEKEEVRKTKAYSAWRQPISAVLALFIQAGVQKPIDKLLQNLTNDAENAKAFRGWVLNQTSLNDGKYLERQVEKDILKYMSEANLKLEDGNIVNAKGEILGAIADKKAAVKVVKNAVAEQQLKNIADSLAKDGKIMMGGFEIKNSAVAGVVNDTINKYVKRLARLKKDKLDYYVDKAKILDANEKEFVELLGEDALKDLPRFKKVVDAQEIEKIDYKALKQYLEEALDRASNDDVKNEIKRILAKPDAVRETSCNSTIWRIGEIRRVCGGTFNADTYSTYMKDQNKALQDRINALNDLKFKNLKTVTPEQIKERIAKFADQFLYKDSDDALKKIFNRSSLFSTDPDELAKKVFRDAAETYKEFAGNKFKLFKQMTKILVGVSITLPITCTALNWVYPRFMNIFLPGLAGVKKEADAKKEGGVK